MRVKLSNIKYVALGILLAVGSTALAATFVDQGGTGRSTFTTSQLIYGNNTNPLSSVATSSVTNGTGIGFTGTAGALVGGTNLTITNTGVTSLAAGTGISLSGSTGAVTISTTGSGGGSGNVATSSQETLGRIPFWTSTNGTPALLSGGTTNFVWNNANALLGISTSSPFGQLSIGMASNTPAIVSWAAGSTSPAFYIGSANQNGNVGFGTAVPDSPITIDMSTTTAPAALGAFTGTAIHLTGMPGLALRIVEDSFGAASVYSLRAAGGSAQAPTALAANQNIFTFGGAGYTGAAYTSTKAQFNMVATQTFTTTANGTAFTFLTTPNNSTVLAEAMRIDQSAYVGIGTTTPAWKLDIATSSASMNTGTGFGQLALTDSGAGANLKHWLFTSLAGNLYIGSTTDQYATSTPAFTILGTGSIGIGTSTPSGALNIVANSLGGLLINTWTNITNALTIVNTSGATVFNVDTTASNPFLGVGTTTPWATISAVSDGTDPIFALSTSTVSGSSMPVEEIDNVGHILTSGKKPTVSGGTSTIAGNDRNATITVVGTLLTSITVTFANAWGSAPDCTMSDSTTGVTAGISSISTTQIVIAFSAGVNSGTVWYICQQHQ